MDLEALGVFSKVAELRSLTRASEHLGVSKSRVSRKLKSLEDELGVRLFHRSTRVVRLTEDGETLLPRARRLVRDVDEIGTLFSGASRLRGRVRVDLPVNLARRFVLPALPALLERHPGLELFVSTTDRFVDAVRGGFDCVLRVGEPADSDLVQKKLGALPMVNCVSRGYAERRGIPRSIDDLDDHLLVHYSPAPGLAAPVFEYERDGETCSKPMTASVTVNGTDAYAAACLAGMGIIQSPWLGMRERIASGRLVEILPEHACAPMPVALLHPHGRRPPRRVRVVMDWIADVLAPHVGVDQ